MDLDKEQQIVERLHASGKLSDLEHRINCDKLERVRQEISASMIGKLE